jgi:hypothetical protein
VLRKTTVWWLEARLPDECNQGKAERSIEANLFLFTPDISLFTPWMPHESFFSDSLLSSQARLATSSAMWAYLLYHRHWYQDIFLEFMAMNHPCLARLSISTIFR